MKFTNGYWLSRPGFTIHGAAEVRAAEMRDGVFTAFVSPRPVTNRGQTLGGVLLTLEFTAPREGVMRVRAYHHKGGFSSDVAFALNTDPASRLDVSEDDTGWTLRSGDKLSARLAKGRYDLSWSYDGAHLTRSEAGQLAYIETPDGPYFRERLTVEVGELFYGLGERFSPFVKNGQSVDVWNEDGGTASEQAYKNVPFYLSSRGYGVFVNHPERVSFEIASEGVSKHQFSVAGEALEYMIVGADSMRGALSRYTALTGRPQVPPDWSFGLWLSTSFTTNYDEATVLSFIDGCFSRGIPLSVFHFDCFWMKEYEWCNFTWDEAVFPDPAGLLARIRERGVRVCVWINSYIGQKSPLFDEALSRGYLVKRADGSAWQWDLWQPGMGLVDFTNPDAVAWYQSKLRALQAMGVDAFKTDFGERIPTDVVWHNGADPQKMHNYYTYLYNKAVHELVSGDGNGSGDGNDAGVSGDGNAPAAGPTGVLFARSATVGCQCFPVHWGGDCEATYVSMAETLRGGLSLALGGFAFWSHDIGGFESTASPDLYKRWIAFGLLSTHSRLHGSTSYRVPWLYDEESVDVLRHFVALKQKLMPYILEQSRLSCAEGIPVMRPMALVFPSDPVCAHLDLQYMLGEELLVAPVFRADGVCRYYLPEIGAEWRHLLTGETKAGGRFYEEAFGYLSLPLYAPAASALHDRGTFLLS